jgi:hypothetical protein
MLVSNPSLRKQMGERSREICRLEFDPKIYVQKMMLLYDSLNTQKSRTDILSVPDTH